MRRKAILIFVVLFLIAALSSLWIIYSKSKSTAIVTNNTKPANNFSDFKNLTNNAVCADKTNSLFSIDGKYVLWVREGDCPDNSYSYTLFGSNVAEELCTSSDSFAGPRTSCKDENFKLIFETITNHLKDDDLGLGSSYKVKKI